MSGGTTDKLVYMANQIADFFKSQPGDAAALRIADHLPRSGFAQRFCAKGRFEGLMADIPVKLITYPQPGLLGAAAAFLYQHR